MYLINNIIILVYDWRSSRKIKYVCLLSSPLCHALQNEIINLIYLFIILFSIGILTDS